MHKGIVTDVQPRLPHKAPLKRVPILLLPNLLETDLSQNCHYVLCCAPSYHNLTPQTLKPLCYHGKKPGSLLLTLEMSFWSMRGNSCSFFFLQVPCEERVFRLEGKKLGRIRILRTGDLERSRGIKKLVWNNWSERMHSPSDNPSTF